MAVNLSVPSTRIKGLMNSFSDMFLNRLNQDPDRQRLQKVMDFIQSKNKARDETFHFLTDPPPFTRWDEGEPRVYGTFGDISWNVPVLKWQSAIQWKRVDEEDDLTNGRLKKQARSIAGGAALVDIEVFFQILTGSTDPDRLKNLPLGADGLALYSSSRTLYETNGNVVSGDGVQSVASIKASFFEVAERISGVRNTHNQLYHPESIWDSPVIVIFNDAHRERFIEAFEAKIIRQGEAGVENILSSSFANVELWPTPRLSGDDWYVFALGMEEKPVFALERNDLGGMELIYADERNSDYCRNYDVRQILCRMRKGYGISLPLGTVKVDNTN